MPAPAQNRGHRLAAYRRCSADTSVGHSLGQTGEAVAPSGARTLHGPSELANPGEAEIVPDRRAASWRSGATDGSHRIAVSRRGRSLTIQFGERCARGARSAPVDVG